MALIRINSAASAPALEITKLVGGGPSITVAAGTTDKSTLLVSLGGTGDPNTTPAITSSSGTVTLLGFTEVTETSSTHMYDALFKVDGVDNTSAITISTTLFPSHYGALTAYSI